MAFVYCSDKVHRTLKVAAAERGISMGDLLAEIVKSSPVLQKQSTGATIDPRTNALAAVVADKVKSKHDNEAKNTKKKPA